MSDGRALFKSKKLLRTERFVVNLRSGLNKILKMGTGEEVAKRNKFAVSFVFNCLNFSMKGILSISF